MKEHLIRAVLYENGDAQWKDEELNGMINVKLNVHQKARQFVEVELGNFILLDDEAVLAAFEKKGDGDFYHINPACMDKVDGESKVYRLQIPTQVHNTPGKWGVQFYAVTNYNKSTGTYEDAIAFTHLYFVEGSSFLDDGLTVPSQENLKAIYDAAIDAKTSAESAVESATTATASAQASANTATTAEANAKTYSESALSSKQTAESAAAVAADSKNQVIAIKEEIDLLVPQIQANTSNIAQNSELLNAHNNDIKTNAFKIAEVDRKANTAIAIAAANKLYTITRIEQAYTSRETACGENIIDGSLAAVTKIKGSTVSCENLIPYPYEPDKVTTEGGITFTINDDGTITVSGAPTSTAVYYTLNYVTLDKGTYSLSGCPSGGSWSSGYSLYIEYGDILAALDAGAGSQFTLTETTRVRVLIRVAGTENVPNVTFKPMLNEGSTALPYQPYFTGLKHAYIDSIKSTGRNLISYPYEPDKVTTEGGVTFTINSDSTITVSGTPTSTAIYYTLNYVTLDKGTYSLSGCPSGGSWGSGYSLYIEYGDILAALDDGVGSQFTLTETTRVRILIRVAGTANVPNVTFKPMLNYGETALPFEPYTEDIYQLPQTLELKEFDSFNPQTGELVRGTKTIVFDGTKEWFKGENDSGIYFATYDRDFVWCTIVNNKFPSHTFDHGTPCGYMGLESIVFFPNADKNNPTITTVEEWKAKIAEWHASGNPLTVAYKSATHTTETIAHAPKSYKAYNHGSETVVQGVTDNSKFGAMATIANEYFKLTEV